MKAYVKMILITSGHEKQEVPAPLTWRAKEIDSFGGSIWFHSKFELI